MEILQSTDVMYLILTFLNETIQLQMQGGAVVSVVASPVLASRGPLCLECEYSPTLQVFSQDIPSFPPPSKDMCPNWLIGFFKSPIVNEWLYVVSPAVNW